MVIYESNVPDFIELSKDPRELAAVISHRLKDRFGIRVAENERNSWMASLPKVADLIQTDKRDNRIVLIEFNIPTSKSRIDFIILGKDKENKPTGLIIELKQWSNVKELDWNEFRVAKYTDSHPSYQADDYRFRLYHEMGLSNKIDLEAVSYLHNLIDAKSPLYSEQYKDILDKAAMYGSLNEPELSKLIDEKTVIREGSASFDLFKDAKWSPTETFKDLMKDQLKKITLVGSQKIIYEKILRFIKSWNKEDKMTFIISGDPGSGKTIIAFKLMHEIVSSLGIKMQMMLPGQEVRKAFIDTWSDKVLSSKISGSNMWNGYDAAIIDEAHKAIGRDDGLVNYRRNFETLKFSIILIDNDQVINRKGVTKEQVIEIAKAAGHSVKDYSIDENFRNSGERTLLDWIDTNIYMRQVINGDHEYYQDSYVNENQKYKLISYDNPDDFVKSYYEIRNAEESTRLTSLWTKGYYVGPADEDGYPKSTISIGDHPFVWNPNEEWKKALVKNDPTLFDGYNKHVKKFTNDRKLFLTGAPDPRFIAYFNHIQGFEFKNIFVYIPYVFTYDNGEIKFHRDRLAKEVKTSQTWSPTSKAKSLTGDPYKLNKTYFLNRLKVMLTRGTKSTHVFAEDKALNDYLRSKIK